jgi:5-methylcytosine-specific restriction endonuclease McrA
MNIVSPILYERSNLEEGEERRKLRSRIRKRLKKKLLAILKNYKCPYCGYEMYRQPQSNRIHKRSITVDHIYSETHGGLYNDLDNTVLCCRKCNKEKGQQLPLNFIWNSSNIYIDNNKTRKRLTVKGSTYNTVLERFDHVY